MLDWCWRQRREDVRRGEEVDCQSCFDSQRRAGLLSWPRTRWVTVFETRPGGVETRIPQSEPWGIGSQPESTAIRVKLSLSRDIEVWRRHHVPLLECEIVSCQLLVFGKLSLPSTLPRQSVRSALFLAWPLHWGSGSEGCHPIVGSSVFHKSEKDVCCDVSPLRGELHIRSSSVRLRPWVAVPYFLPCLLNQYPTSKTSKMRLGLDQLVRRARPRGRWGGLCRLKILNKEHHSFFKMSCLLAFPGA